MQDKALARATAGLSAESRSVQVAWFGEFGDRAVARFRDGNVVVEAVGSPVSLVEPVTGAGPARGHASSAPMSQEPVAVVEELEKSHGATPVLHGLSASFAPGLLHVVTGPSGSGKTTFLHLLAGLERADRGRIEVVGRDLTPLARSARAAIRRQSIAYVAQDGGLVPHLSAIENIDLGLAIRGMAQQPGESLRALDLVGLADRATQRVERLSHGERARVAIARAVAARPALLLADEPTARLDVANAVSVAGLLSRLAREIGTAVICATHDPLVVEQADHELRLG
jgi:putative ABC transport system ATP-binding protein